MKQYTNEEIIAKVQEIFDTENEIHCYMGWESKGCITIERNTPKQVSIQISCMYEAPSPNLEVMTKLAKFFETENINDDDAFAYDGCETCNYGSEYGYTLTIRP